MNIFQKIWVGIIRLIGKVNWKPKNLLSPSDLRVLREKLSPNYYIIVTRRNNHLSTYFISLGHFFLTGKFGYWSHVCMNLEDSVTSDNDFKIIEAIGTGVQYSKFQDVFNCNSVALLKPKNMSIEYWTKVLDRARTEVGKPYDDLFDLKNDQALSCVELVRDALKAEPNYYQNFAAFERMISKEKNLTPQMFYNCSDFEVVYEVRHR